MKLKKTLMALLLQLVCVLSVQAGETTFRGVGVDYGQASTNWVDGELVLTYKNSSQLKLDGMVRADVLVVGGGGGGGRSNSTSSYYGSGDGGKVLAIVNQMLPSGSYEIAIGSGGSGAGSNGRTGSVGGESSLKGDSVSKTVAGGAGGGTSAAAGSPTTGTESSITGSSVFYGKGGVKATNSSTAGKAGVNPGDGGTGNKKGSSGGSGAKGIVVVRLKGTMDLLKEQTLPIGETVSEFRDASGDPVSFAYSDVTCSSSVDLVASVVETADGKVGVVGHMAGTAEVSIITADKTYVCTVRVSPLITGNYWAGAYEVAVTNASEVKYVGDDLVITYLDTSAAEKSFTLPKDTTGRLLAVGGGGAGGQDEKRAGTKSSPTGGYDEKYGLPGGGGAGGLIVNDVQDFAAEAYTVTVGAGGAAVGREFVNAYVPDYQQNMNVWRPTSYGPGANGSDTVVRQGTTVIATAKGGGGGGHRSKNSGVGQSGGSGGGGSYSGGSKTGGTGTTGQGNAGGKGGHAKFGAGGGGAGGLGGNTSNDAAYGSGAGGAGKACDITGENLEYARGGAGGVPRVYQYYYEDKGQVKYTDTKPSVKYFWCEAEDGKPGRDGYGDGGGGSGHYGTNPTFAGRGGNGAVIVRIPPYKTTVEDALKKAFADQPATVSGNAVTLNGDVAGPIAIPDNLGAISVNLNGYAIVGANGAEGDDITPGGNGKAALAVVAHTYASEANATTEVTVTGTGSLKGGNGGKGYPGGVGAAAVVADGFTVNVADGIAVEAGTAGESLVQHPHKWAYTVEDGKIIAYCVADDGVPCSYRDHSRGPFVAISAADAAYTAMRYDELTAVNGITPVTGIVIAPETYAGRDGTDYPESSTPPREQGAYTVSMQLGDLRITSDFTITAPKPSQGSVYQAWKTAERKGRDVQIVLSATFDGSRAINDGNVLFLGSRCSAHSMANGTVESSVNALTRYANVRWYAYGSSDPDKNLVNRLTRKGETLSAGTVPLVGGNHFVHKEMMDDLYAELVEKKNLDTGYDLIILEFDGDLLCREGFAPYQLNYRLPEEWTDEKAARLRAAMGRYYAEDRVVWIVPDVNQEKEDAGYTGEYPWTSNPEFIWQRTFLNATETEGYRCPLQKNYEDTDALIAYLQEVLVGHFFSNAIIKDTLANGLTIKKVTPQKRSDGGIWRNFEGGPSRYTIPEPRSGTTVTADVERVERQVTVTFDMKAEQAWACEHNQVIGDDFRVVIDAALDGFFSGVDEGGEKATNDGDATFTFTDPNLEEDADDYEIEINVDSPTIQNVKPTPDYTAEDVVKIYDGKGTNIVVKPIAPTPDEAVIRYSLDEHGTYVDNFALTNVCDKTKVWFTLTDKSGEFTTVTNYACVTILPLPPGPPQEESMGITASPAEKFYDAEATNITWAVTNATGGVISDVTISLREKGASAWIPAADFTLYVDTTNVTVEVKAEKSGFDPVTAEATVVINPRPVTLVAASDSKVYDGLPLTNWTFTVKTDTTTEGYGFVKDEGVASVTMTPESTVTLPDTVPNVIASETAKAGTKLERNYTVTTEPGTLTVTAAAFTSSATPYDEFYDGQEHTIEVDVQKPENAGEATITYSYAEGGTYLPIEDFEQLKDVTAGGPVTVYAKVEIEGYSTVVVSSTVNIKPRIVVEQAESASKIFDGMPLVQPNHHEDADSEAEKSKERWGTVEALANSTGFIAGEGFAAVPMTSGSTITEPGVEDNVIDVAEVTLKANTKPGNYIFYYLPGELTVIQRQEEVRRDPEVVIPEESKKVVEESDKKIEKTLGEMAKSDQEATGEPYVKYQLTVTPTNGLNEATRTSPEKATEDAKRQIELFKEEMPDAKIGKVEFVDVVLERTYSKEEAEETAKGNYNKDNWESRDKAEEHGNKLLEVTIPVEVPDGMELAGVTRSCDSKGTEILKPRDPDDPTAEGFVYDPETKTVTLYAYDFCVFGFMMKKKAEVTPPCPPSTPCCETCGSPCGWGYKVKVLVRTTAAKSQISYVSCGCATPSCGAACYRKPTTRRFIGYVFGRTVLSGPGGCPTCGCSASPCSTCDCNDWSTFDLVVWNYDRKTPVAVKDVALLQFNRYGEKVGSDAEMSFRVRATDSAAPGLCDLTFSGFGKVGPRTDGTTALKSASGFCAGVLPQYCEKVAKDACGTQTVGLTRTKIWTVCGTSAYSGLTAAYGKWVISWDSTIVSRISLGRIAFEPLTKAVSGYVPVGFEDAPVYYVENGHYAGDDEDASFEDLRDWMWDDEISE